MSAAKILALSSVLTANAVETRPGARTIPQWDTDSGLVGIDNRCSGCMSHLPEDFVGDLRPCSRIIKGFGGTCHFIVQQGTLKWHWEDDNGKVHKFVIPNSYYIPEGGVRLLPPSIGRKPK